MGLLIFKVSGSIIPGTNLGRLVYNANIDLKENFDQILEYIEKKKYVIMIMHKELCKGWLIVKGSMYPAMRLCLLFDY